MSYKYFPVTIASDGRKIPLIKDWQTLATTDPAQLEQWQGQFRERLTHWGVPTGPDTGLLVLDVDVKDKDKNGFQTIQDLQLPIADTASQRTLTGGMHYIFQYPTDGERCGNRVAFQPGLDIRGEGGYIVAYELDNKPIAVAPQWLIETSRVTYELPEGDAIGIAPAIAEASLEDCLQEIYDAPEGERNNTLNTQAFKVNQLVASGAITKEYADAKLKEAALHIGLRPNETRLTMESAHKGGMSKPLTSPFTGPPPAVTIPLIPQVERWTPPYFTPFELNDVSKLKKPQLFKDWSTEDIHITTADGGTGKTTLKLYEAIHLALGERFLGFECVTPGKTLFITGEDSALKLGAMIGAITKDMGIDNDPVKMNTILSSVVVKKDSDLCIITKDKQNFLQPNLPSLEKVMQAVDDIKPKMIVFDPISTFWGSESALNDMAKAVSRFMGTLVERSNACVEMVNHMGKQSSNNKDMSQFAGRGGTGLPSHARVSRVLRPVDSDEYLELTGETIGQGESAMLCNVNKFSDGSHLYNKPFLIIRKGYMFSKREVTPEASMKQEKENKDTERVFAYVKECRNNGMWPTKNVIIGYFMQQTDSLSETRVKRALDMLCFIGLGREKVRPAQGPDAENKDKVYIITDHQGVEV